MAGIRGFEPLNDGIKTRCLTAWLYPCNVLTFYVQQCCFEMVRVKRLELSHLAILEPKSSASTNSAKPAYIQFLKRLELFLLKYKYLSKMVATPGLEPGTPSLWVMCSNQLSYVAFETQKLSDISRYLWIDSRGVFLFSRYLKWCGSRDLNSHILRYWNLNPARLPIPPNPHTSKV